MIKWNKLKCTEIIKRVPISLFPGEPQRSCNKLYYKVIGVTVAIVISTMIEWCIDLNELQKFRKYFKSSKI